MLQIYFLARHTPFWAVPVILMGVQFAYLFWLRRKHRAALFCLSFAVVALLCTGFYFWAGGPDKTVGLIKKFHRDHVR